MSLPSPNLPIPKLPLPTNPAPDQAHDLAKFSAQVVQENMQNVRNSSGYIRRSFNTLYGMYVSLFLVGIATAIVAILKGFTAQSPGEAVGSVAIAGLSAASFFTIFLSRPLESLERTSIYSAWLTAVTNTYWTRLMYFSDPRTIEADLTSATNGLVADLTRLSERHAQATVKRASGDTRADRGPAQ